MCHIGQQVIGGRGLADDLQLLPSSNKHLQNLAYIFEDIAQVFDIAFNGTKNKYLVIANWSLNHISL